MPEKWEEVVFGGEKWPYEVSSLGDVMRSGSNHGATVGHIMKGGKTNSGYRQVALRRPGEKRWVYVHDLVATAFLGPKPEGMIVHHQDGDKVNNEAENLEHLSYSENAKCAIVQGVSSKEIQEIREEARSLASRYEISLWQLSRLISNGELT